MRALPFIITLFFIFTACEENVQPKPKSFLALEFPPHRYQPVDIKCPFQFEVNRITAVQTSKSGEKCWFDINYPSMNGTIYITYQEVNNNLKGLLKDAQALPLKHTIKADEIQGDAYLNPGKKTFGTFYKVTGNAASQAQFYLTDSTQHFLTGSVYFRSRPNYDSILPAADYIEKDIKHLMESVKWAE